MSYQFVCVVSPGEVEIRLYGSAGSVPSDLWPVTAPADLLAGVDLAQRLAASGGAILDGDLLLVEHRTVAGLSPREAQSVSLPAPADVVAHVQTRGAIGRAGFGAELRWQRPTGAPVLGVERCGAFLKIGGEWRRLPDVLFEIAEAVDRLNGVAADDLAGQLAGLAALREVLPSAVSDGAAEAGGLLGSMTIAIADAFSLDLKGEGDDAKLVPVLHQSGAAIDTPLLDRDRQTMFGETQFNQFSAARSVYTLGGGYYVVLSPPLRRALAEVRKVQNTSGAHKRALLATPRAFLREALGGDVEETVLEGLFRETQAYADRVLGLGLWTPRVVPWIRMPTTNWFGPDEVHQSTSKESAADAPGGIMLGDRSVALTSEEVPVLRQQIEEALGAGRTTIPFVTSNETVDVPASYETLAALEALTTARTRPEAALKSEATKTTPDVLLIRPNEDEVEVEGEYAPRPSPAFEAPRTLATALKAHQAEGLAWLQKAWSIGRPGVLLADDMGLGKTIQGLAFLAWLREGMTSGVIPRAPIAIVAPTGLLQNWRAEHDRHLKAPGLGTCTEAFGRGLACLKRVAPDGRPSLDSEALAGSDWVLTTYETLRDYDRDFGRVRFAALLFDEAQKIKTPGVRLTDAAKAMNADFRVALTGTPVENRLSDLWCITDAVHPAFLGDLKSFSATYERSPDTDSLKKLKLSLDAWLGGRPPLLLRRLKKDRLPDLPEAHEILREAPMPGPQRIAYEAAIAEARQARKSGAILEALHRLRLCSLHPHRESVGTDEAFIASSARLRLAFEVLDQIAERKERALIFLGDLDMQARLVGLIQRRYSLAQPPMVINGQVAGAVRQARVDRFQAGPDTFDAMILSPQAGGVGLTLTRANHVIHLARWWNPAVEDQCTGRVLRIGQTRPVSIHIPIATLPDGRPSFDQNLHALLARKRRLMHEALMPPEMTEADREALFSGTVAA